MRGSEDPLLGRGRGARGAVILMNRQRWQGQVPVMLMNGHYRAEMRGGKQHRGSSHEERLSFAPRISVNSLIMSEASPLLLLLLRLPCRHLLLSFSKLPKIPDCVPAVRELHVKN